MDKNDVATECAGSKATVPHDIEFVIVSLKTSSERRRLMAAQMSRQSRPWRFFDALTAVDRTLPYDAERSLIRRGYRLRPTEIGCFSSHFQCLKEHAASFNGANYMVVLEDDVFIDETFDFNLLTVAMSVLDIHYFKLYSRFLTRCRFIGRLGQRGIYRFVVPPYGTQAYVVSKAGARRATESITRIDRPIDDELDRYWSSGLPTYAVFPYPVIELSLRSTIDKGFSAPDIASASQRLARFGFNWLDKIPRECADARLRNQDRRLAKAIAKSNLWQE